MSRHHTEGVILKHRTPLKTGLLLAGTILIILGSWSLSREPVFGATSLLLGIFCELGVAFIYREEILAVESRVELARRDVEDAQQEIEEATRTIRSIQADMEELSDDLFESFGRYGGWDSMERRIDNVESQVEDLEREVDDLNRGSGRRL